VSCGPVNNERLWTDWKRLLTSRALEGCAGERVCVSTAACSEARAMQARRRDRCGCCLLRQLCCARSWECQLASIIAADVATGDTATTEAAVARHEPNECYEHSQYAACTRAWCALSMQRARTCLDTAHTCAIGCWTQCVLLWLLSRLCGAHWTLLTRTCTGAVRHERVMCLCPPSLPRPAAERHT
jgi:hypothetical protein